MNDVSKRVLDAGRAVLEAEAAAIRHAMEHLDETFAVAAEMILGCEGRVAVSGMGKAGLVGEKISATMASTGTPSFFLHPAEAVHGDLGRLRKEDVALVLSNSGESDEVIRLIDPLRSFGVRMIAMTGNDESRLARYSDCHLHYGRIEEACPLGLAPTSSTTVMIALGDALAMAVLEKRDFGRESYARFHPGGSLGRKLMKVDEIMRRDDEHTVVADDATCHEALLAMNRTKGRPGAASVVDRSGRLRGFVTDGDLVRALEHGAEFLTRPVTELMMTTPKVVDAGCLASEAVFLLRSAKVDQLPVIDADQRPIGLIDVQDLVDARVT